MVYAHTSHNRSVKVRPFGARLRKNAVGASPLCAFFLRHIFAFARNCYRSFLIAKAKTSFTAETLHEIPLAMV
ncbi:hypothetical protein R84B8_01137 [Treponema sp. R8-4-B8]